MKNAKKLRSRSEHGATAIEYALIATQPSLRYKLWVAILTACTPLSKTRFLPPWRGKLLVVWLFAGTNF
jgi:hypothetical protein